MTTETLKSLRSDNAFDLFWQKVNNKADELEISEPRLPRRRKLPRRLDDGLSDAEFHATPKSYYRQQYFEALDLIVSCIDDRFDQPGYRIYRSLETLLAKACMQQDFTSDLKIVCDFYGDDFDHDLLCTQLQTLGVHYQQKRQAEAGSTANLTIFDVKDHLLSLSLG